MLNDKQIEGTRALLARELKEAQDAQQELQREAQLAGNRAIFAQKAFEDQSKRVQQAWAVLNAFDDRYAEVES